MVVARRGFKNGIMAGKEGVFAKTDPASYRKDFAECNFPVTTHRSEHAMNGSIHYLQHKHETLVRFITTHYNLMYPMITSRAGTHSSGTFFTDYVCQFSRRSRIRVVRLGGE